MSVASTSGGSPARAAEWLCSSVSWSTITGQHPLATKLPACPSARFSDSATASRTPDRKKNLLTSPPPVAVSRRDLGKVAGMWGVEPEPLHEVFEQPVGAEVGRLVHHRRPSI